METPVQRCVRIATALDDLAAQEAAALAAHNFSGVLVLQDRAAPLVEFLAANAASHAGDAVLRTRVAAVQARRACTSALLAAEIERARTELLEAGFAQNQVAKIGPAYGRAAAARSQLCAVG